MKRLVIAAVIIVCVLLSIQLYTLPYGNALSTLLPSVPLISNRIFRTEESPIRSNGGGELHLSDGLWNLNDTLVIAMPDRKGYISNMYEEAGHGIELQRNDIKLNIDSHLENDSGPNDDLLANDGEDLEDVEFAIKEDLDEGDYDKSEKAKTTLDGSHEKQSAQEMNSRLGQDASYNNVKKSNISVVIDFRSKFNNVTANQIACCPLVSKMNGTASGTLGSNLSSSPYNDPASSQPLTKVVPNTDDLVKFPSNLGTSNGSSSSFSIPLIQAKEKMLYVPPTPIPEMNRMLQHNRVFFHSMKPLRPSIHDQEILSAKGEIMNAPTVRNDPELYPSVFRNVSIFKRSYELMERKLKVYIYKDGSKPIYHTPVLKGIYASEGWFMKLMEGNRHFRVKDPRKAQLFYMPFSSRFLEFALYVLGSHNHKILAEQLKNYVDKISAKYPFWNRTGGTDHFLVACHDWAPYETRPHMERSIRALCNADLSEGFILGKDVSLPETIVRWPQNPLRGLGGNPASKRQILAFFAGNMHGTVRPILIRHWENKDPAMKIFGPMPASASSKRKTAYIQYMKTSKYCICPRGFEVNSPRVVEAIFYECVPVIISDNFVPPFFEILDWEAFAVFIAEKDIPALKDILLSIPETRYLEMQLRVRKVQQHFLWHSKPVKYDLFHMILHSIWFNRVFTLAVR